MKDEPLLAITRVLDCDFDADAVGSLDYHVSCHALERWLAAGAHRGQSVTERRSLFAMELRALADAIESGGSPFTGTIVSAEERATEIRARNAELMRAEMRSVE